MSTPPENKELGKEPGSHGSRQPTQRRTRTRNGCLNCRRRKRKCDEGHPRCQTCCKRGENCEWGLKVIFRDENAQSIGESHPSMKSMARKKPPKEFAIKDLTSRVVRHYTSPTPPMDSDDDIAEATIEPDVRLNRENVLRSDRTFSVSETGSSSSLSFVEQISAQSVHLSPSNAHFSPSNHLALGFPIDSLPMDTLAVNVTDYPCLNELQTFTPDTIVEDGIFLPGSAYHELHSTLRNHLIQEVNSTAPTRAPTPGVGDEKAVDEYHGNSPGDSSSYRNPSSETEIHGDFRVDIPDMTDAGSTKLPLSNLNRDLLPVHEECELWRNWIDEIAPWLDKFDRERTFQVIIPTMARDCDHLRYSMLALSARQFELKDDSLPTDRSLMLYQEAVHQLLPQLPTRSTSVIATCVILCVLEMGSCSPKAWRRHLDGCASLMEAVGINGFVGGTEQALFWCFARMDVCGGLISSVETLIPVENWVANAGLEADIEFFQSSLDFEQWANLAVYLVASVLSLLAPLPLETLRAPARNDPVYRARWLQLWHAICNWSTQRPAALLPIMTIPSSEKSPFPTLLYSNPAAISGNQLHHTASILMLQNQPHGLQLSPKPRSILWHARQVCGIGISNDNHGAWTNGVQPLWIAGRCMSHPSEHQAILAHLEKIERESGWRTSWRADDLKEFWGDLED